MFYSPEYGAAVKLPRSSEENGSSVHVAHPFYECQLSQGG